MEKFVEINSSGEVVLDKEIISIVEHKERVCQGNLREEFEQLVQRGKELIEQIDMEWREPEEIVREMREKREMNMMESLGCER